MSLSSFNSGFGGQAGMFPIDEQGRYAVSGLGPYQWELLFAVFPYAYEWSGDAATRDRANTVKVKKDEAVTYDTSVGPGTTVSGLITDQTGTVANAGRITFLNADTGDEIAFDDIFDNGAGQYVAQVKGPQRVKVSYVAFVGAQSYVGLVGGATFAEATTFTIPENGVLTLDIIVTQIQV
ncbi:MAG TPA: hypothetical protein VFY84_03640 [Jiangellales bacterium]|nr:hypothetical protein [Jiangellales bacterium]